MVFSSSTSAAMRRETAIADTVLDRVASGADGRRIGYLGDQTLYKYIRGGLSVPDAPAAV